MTTGINIDNILKIDFNESISTTDFIIRDNRYGKKEIHRFDLDTTHLLESVQNQCMIVESNYVNTPTQLVIYPNAIIHYVGGIKETVWFSDNDKFEEFKNSIESHKNIKFY